MSLLICAETSSLQAENIFATKGVVMQTCKGKTRTGAACRAPAGAGGLCFFHADPDRAKSLGQIGGRKNRRSVVDLEVPENMTAADVCKVAGQAIRMLLAGELKAREAGAVAQLCNSLYRVIPTADLEARVAMLEQQVAQEERGALREVDPIESPPSETVAAAESDVLLAAEQTPCPTDAPTPGLADGGDGADSRSDEPDETGEA